MNDSFVPSKRILRPYLTPGSNGLSSTSPSNGQIKIKKHKLFSPRPTTSPTHTTFTRKEPPLFSIFQSIKSKHGISPIKPTSASTPNTNHVIHCNNSLSPKVSVTNLSKDNPPTDSLPTPPPECTLLSSTPQLVSPINRGISKKRQPAPWPDKTVFQGGHIRQSSTTSGSLPHDPLDVFSPTCTNMDTILKTQGKTYWDSVKQKRLVQQQQQQQQPTTTSPPTRRDSYDMDEIILKMDQYYLTSWRIPACQHLLDRGKIGDEAQWCDKYRPTHVDGLLDNQTHHHYLRDWLEQQKVAFVKKDQKKLNMILLVGPHGVGKTAGVYTAAQETGYQVFEIHPGIKRSLKEIKRLVGDMTKNHHVRFDGDSETRVPATSLLDGLIDLPVSANDLLSPIQYGQSLVLLEEVDLVYQSDKGFWTAVCDLARTSKRPIILTCNDTSVIPFDMLSLQAVIRYEAPQTEVLFPYLHLVCLMEGFDIPGAELISLVKMVGLDLRQLLMTLEYLHHGHQPPLEIQRQPVTDYNNSMIQAHVDLLIKQVAPLWLCKSDRIPGAQVTPLCMQLLQNDTGSQTDCDLDLFTTLQVWLNNRSLIDTGVGMTQKRLSQVYGLDDYYGANEKNHEYGYLHFWKTPGDWDHDESEAYMESTLLEWNHLCKGSGLVDIMSWEIICDKRHKQKEDNLLFVRQTPNYGSTSFSVWTSSIDIYYSKQLAKLRRKKNKKKQSPSNSR
ncbi:P-loop containing nucleoside triphosphate hydrolase protein [Chlamydoabsidia padenii]|nr:P-loop containing nucleoside triphosphate hydrolase protein [Chlamydoabsidia padenii]